ncbi:MAG TPA: fused MFS/spermidine synthase [Rhizomicrobium sp.]|nr:fused MFS/spermidine synthase [Rhizomicrobium sp.]
MKRVVAEKRGGPPVIEQHNATGRVSFWEHGDHHSVADANGVSLADYIHAMFGFLRQAKARHVLMIGAGGGTLATMLHRVGVRVTMVDINPLAFEVARRYFNLPDAVECHVADGVAFVRRSPVRYDAIVVDAYTKQTMPKVFLRPSFFALAKSRLRPHGLVLMNLLVTDDDDRAPDRIVRSLQKTWRHARLLDVDGWDDRNAVAVAGNVTKLKRPKLLMRPARGAKKLASLLKDLDFRALRA